MTEKDKMLIAQAKKFHYADWDKISELIEQADTEEAKEELKDISCALYHKAEYYAGMQ